MKELGHAIVTIRMNCHHDSELLQVDPQGMDF